MIVEHANCSCPVCVSVKQYFSNARAGDPNTYMVTTSETFLTKREYFAAHAPITDLFPGDESPEYYKLRARTAVAYADALIKELEKK